jgi:hypothetical protein
MEEMPDEWKKQCCHVRVRVRVRVRVSLATELVLCRGPAILQDISSTVPVMDIFDLRGR